MHSLRDEEPIAPSPSLRLLLLISPARRASLFSSAKSAEENVCVYLRPSAANTNIFHLQSSVGFHLSFSLETLNP